MDGVEAQTVHARIEFDVDGPAGDAFLAGCFDEGIHQTEGVDFGLEVVVEHRLERRHLGIHDHYIGGDAGLAERDPLIGHGHGKVVYAVILKRLGNLHGPCPIGVGLDHAHHLGLGFQERAVVVQVLHDGIEVHLEDGLVNLLFQLFCDAVEAEWTGSLKEYQFVAKVGNGFRGEEMVDVGVELLVSDLDPVGLGREFRANADELADTSLQAEVGHLGIERLRRGACLKDVAEHKRLVQALPYRRILAPLHEVEGDVEGVDVAVVGVVDEDAAALALLHLESHGDGFEAGHPLCQLCRRQPQVQGHSRTGDGVLDAGFVDKGYRIAVLLVLPDIGNPSRGRNGGCTLDEEGHVLVTLRPGDLLALVLHPADATTHDVVVGTVDHRLGVVHQFQLLHALLLHRSEVLLMGGA